MYIQRVELTNVRSFERLTMRFDSPYAGWHVVIGDNATGKSTLLRAVAMGFLPSVGPIKPYIRSLLRHGEQAGQILVELLSDREYDPWVEDSGEAGVKGDHIKIKNQKIRDIPENEQSSVRARVQLTAPNEFLSSYSHFAQEYRPGFRRREGGWFAASYGPFRRIDTRKTPVATDEWEEFYLDDPFVSPHISLFNQNIIFSHLIAWLKDLRFKELESDSSEILRFVLQLVNEGGLLAPGFKIVKVSSDEVLFETPDGVPVPIVQLSDGYRSVLSITFDLIRQLIRSYGEHKVFQHIAKGELFIDLPGVVLIDEVDSHLHPTWQVRIGKWFTQFFPQIQFIVTTHSPLICQSAHPGSIWRLASPGSDQRSGQVTGSDYNRLIYGNVLDAYGTELFGEDVTRSHEAMEKLNRLALLNIKSIHGETSEAEEAERERLQILLPGSSNVLPEKQ